MPSISLTARKEINKLITDLVTKYLNKATNSPTNNSGNPFVMALLKDFEPLLHRIHGLKTSLGGEMEKIAEIIAKESWGSQNVQRKQKINVILPANVFQTIDQIMSKLSRAEYHPNYINEKKAILAACKRPSKKMQEHTYEFDLRLFDPGSGYYFFTEMKGPDPNTTEVPGAKRRLLTCFAWTYWDLQNPNVECFLGVYYNNKFPAAYKNYKVLNYFDPSGDLKIHTHFWNFIGRSNTTYSELLKLFNDYGKKHKKEIWDGFSKLISVK